MGFDVADQLFIRFFTFDRYGRRTRSAMRMLQVFKDL
jgi:hypothetical protein